MSDDRFVIDASIAIKWVVDEPGTAQAILLRRRQLFAPDLMIAECSNILWKKVRRAELSEAEAMLAARLLQRADIRLEPLRPLLEPATRLALTLDHPAYDCVYLAVARKLDCPMVTADEVLCRKARSAAFSPPLLLLADFTG
jgi:predicted nucleic acid-binding protein